MQHSNITILPEGILGWSLLIIIFILLVLFVTVLNPRTKRNQKQTYGNMLDTDEPDVFQIIQRKVKNQVNIWNEKNTHEAINHTVYTSFNPESNEAVVVRIIHDKNRVIEIERVTYFIHASEVKATPEMSKKRLDEAVNRDIDVFNDILSVNSDTFMEDGELIGVMHVRQKVQDNTGETVLFTNSKLKFKDVENKLLHEGYEKV